MAFWTMTRSWNMQTRAPRTDVMTPSKQAMNGDSVAVEPAKTVNPSPGLMDPETKLNAEEITILRSESVNSINTSSGRSSRLGRVFTAKHEKHKSRGNQPRGEVEMSIRYADATRKLVVQVLRAKQLLPWDKNGDCDPYANVGSYLLIFRSPRFTFPFICAYSSDYGIQKANRCCFKVKLISIENSKDVQKRKTAVVKGTVNPSFDNHRRCAKIQQFLSFSFEFDVDPGDLHNYKLQICVKDDTNYGAFSSKPILGQIDIRLSSLDNCSLPQQWVRLEAERI
ncbi:C2 domain protein [Ancylostoma caninum]|uniref:C2 domain protein n=1 Tax=Ancylostoma caninum TaxID=29170 RepID=A0A368GE97_ANCCA|nr:C2 domain protein [Ancylostoma caninum]